MIWFHGIATALVWWRFVNVCSGAPSGAPDWCEFIPETEKGKFPLCTGSHPEAPLMKSAPARSNPVPPSEAASSPDVENQDEQLRIDMCPEGKCDVPAAPDKVLTNRDFYEGDIAGLSKDALQGLLAGHGAVQANAVREESLRWPGGEVPYVISKWLLKAGHPEYEKAIMDAIAMFHDNTCVKFRPRQDSDPDYLSFFSGIGCSSYVGKRGGVQGIQLQVPDCMKPGLISHEIMHALGFYHEQARTDRDEFVEINDANIASANKIQFKSYLRPDITSYGLTYDFGSVLHYAEKDFAIDPNIWTIRPKKKFHDANIAIMGQREKPSDTDFKKIKAMYRCTTPGPCSTNPGWFKSNGWCYYFSFLADELEKSFVEARNLCRKLEATMANPSQATLTGFIGRKLKENTAKSSRTDQIWMDGCRLTSLDDLKLIDAESCDQSAHFVCQKRAAAAKA